MPDVGALIIASAPGSGLGGALALGSWGDRSVLDHVLEVVAAAGIEDVTVVLGPRADDVLASIAPVTATIVIDPEWREGTASALRAGLDTMWRSADLTTALVVELDHPDIDPGALESVLAAHRSGGSPVTIPKYRYSHGGPIAIDRNLWPRLMGLEGVVDLVELVDAHKEWADEVWIDRVPPARVDTRSDLEAVAPRR